MNSSLFPSNVCFPHETCVSLCRERGAFNEKAEVPQKQTPFSLEHPIDLMNLAFFKIFEQNPKVLDENRDELHN